MTEQWHVEYFRRDEDECVRGEGTGFSGTFMACLEFLRRNRSKIRLGRPAPHGGHT